MRVRKHRGIGELVRQRSEAVDDRAERRQHHFVARRFEHQRVAQVVDVLRGAREMDELGDPGYFSK